MLIVLLFLFYLLVFYSYQPFANGNKYGIITFSNSEKLGPKKKVISDILLHHKCICNQAGITHYSLYQNSRSASIDISKLLSNHSGILLIDLFTVLTDSQKIYFMLDNLTKNSTDLVIAKLVGIFNPVIYLKNSFNSQKFLERWKSWFEYFLENKINYAFRFSLTLRISLMNSIIEHIKNKYNENGTINKEINKGYLVTKYNFSNLSNEVNKKMYVYNLIKNLDAIVKNNVNSVSSIFPRFLDDYPFCIFNMFVDNVNEVNLRYSYSNRFFIILVHDKSIYHNISLYEYGI